MTPSSPRPDQDPTKSLVPQEAEQGNGARCTANHEPIDIGEAPHSNRFRFGIAALVIIIVAVIVMVITDTQSTGEFPLQVPKGQQPVGGF